MNLPAEAFLCIRCERRYRSTGFAVEEIKNSFSSGTCDECRKKVCGSRFKLSYPRRKNE